MTTVSATGVVVVVPSVTTTLLSSMFLEHTMQKVFISCIVVISFLLSIFKYCTPLYQFLKNSIKYIFVDIVYSLFVRSISTIGGGGQVLVMDTGRHVRLGRQIAEGGYSYVFEGLDVTPNISSSSSSSSIQKRRKYSNNNSNKRRTTVLRYAVKRIYCPERDMIESCQREVAVHRGIRHSNLMPVLGSCISSRSSSGSGDDKKNHFYMLFPLLSSSLRDVVHSRTIDRPEVCPNTNTNTMTQQQFPSSSSPWDEIVLLRMFYRICIGVYAMHERLHLSHRDIKLDNILLMSSTSRRPILMDFGSTGPLQEKIDHRKDIMEICEHATQHTTISYRPPELFFNCTMIHPGETPIDYTKVDVWSLGCTLYAMMYGTSPFEMEFHRTTGQTRIVECTELSILKTIPKPIKGTFIDTWYSQHVIQLVHYILIHDRHQRPTLYNVIQKVKDLFTTLGGGGNIDHDDDNDNEEDLLAMYDLDDDDDDDDDDNKYNVGSIAGGGGDQSSSSSDGIALMNRNRVL